MAIAHAVWKRGVDPQNTTSHYFDRPDTLGDTLDKAKASRKQDVTLNAAVAEAACEPQFHNSEEASVYNFRNWQIAAKVPNHEKKRSLLITKQFEMVKRVADQICFERDNEHTPKRLRIEPLRLILHGGPGTGKSHVF